MNLLKKFRAVVVLVLVNLMTQLGHPLSVCMFLPQYVGFAVDFSSEGQDNSGRCIRHMSTWPRWRQEGEGARRLLHMPLGKLIHMLFLV